MTPVMRQPFVFYEPSGKRWRRLRLATQTAAALLTVAVGLVLISVVVSPKLPKLVPPAGGSPSAASRTQRIIWTESANRVGSNPVNDGREDTPPPAPAAGQSLDSVRRPFVWGYYVNWDPASIVSLRLNVHALTHLVPEWLILQNAHGDLDDVTDPSVIHLAAQARVPILAMVTNFRGAWQADELHHLLNDPGARRNLVDNIYSNVLEHHFAGVNVDFERLSRQDRHLMTRLIGELRARLEPAGLLVTQRVPADDPAYDLDGLATVNDYLVVMVYDEHVQSGSPGPVASRTWFADRLSAIARRLPSDRTIIGLGNYGYDWVGGAGPATPVAFSDVMAAAGTWRGALSWDDASGNPLLRYTAGGEQHVLWFLDAVTALNQARRVAASGLRGVALWRLGAEDPGVWHVLSHSAWRPDGDDPARLVALEAQKTVRQYGEGDILRVVRQPRAGIRRIATTPDGELTERYERLPSYYVIESIGRAPNNTIALTFDDGPDARFTPQILDILRAKQAPAAFFVVGTNAEARPDLLKRMYADGHEIGNHTYSHPDIGRTSFTRTRLELNATQRIIQHTLGVSTTLFRPPYRADSEPQTPEEIEPILRAQKLGYLTIGERIDPHDWDAGVTADGIVTEVLAEYGNGGIVLLHDGGGDRSATVAALPRIIDELRSRGIRLVHVGELIGRTREELMPSYSGSDLRFAELAGWAFGFKAHLGAGVAILFVGSLCLIAARTMVFGTLAIQQKRRARRRVFDSAFRPRVSVIVPAHNEAAVVAATVQSVLDNDVTDLDVVIVDDGSTDATVELLRTYFGTDRRVRVYSQRKAGKAAALNHAVQLARYDIVVAIDADTVLGRDTIGKLVRHFADPAIGAVSGNARVAGKRGWITRFQSIEYICTFNLDRRALDLVNAITVVPGAIGAWRKAAIAAGGGFPADTLAEDTDLTLAIRRLGYRIVYDGEAVAYTAVPHNTRALVRQRFRWLFGTLQAAWKHRDALARPRYGTLGFVALPSIWLFQLVLPLTAPAAEITMLAALYAGNWHALVLYASALLALDLVAGILAYALEGERPVDLVLLAAQRAYYRYLLLYVTVKSVIYALKGRWVEWKKVERHLTLPARGPAA